MKIPIKECLKIPYRRCETDIVIPSDALECLHRWGRDAIGNERMPDSYNLTFTYDDDGIERKWMLITAIWEASENEYDKYKTYVKELNK